VSSTFSSSAGTLNNVVASKHAGKLTWMKKESLIDEKKEDMAQKHSKGTFRW